MQMPGSDKQYCRQSIPHEANAAMLVTFILRPLTQNAQLVLPVQTGLYRYNE